MGENPLLPVSAGFEIRQKRQSGWIPSALETHRLLSLPAIAAEREESSLRKKMPLTFFPSND
jgi:hypothetical protein